MNTVSGESAAAMTHRKPTTEDAPIAQAGTPLLLTVIKVIGASRRAASTNSILEDVYRPELRQDSTAVRTTAFMMSAAPGMFIASKAATYGEAASCLEFHGTMHTTRKTEPT